jgi:hypothetical protein
VEHLNRIMKTGNRGTLIIGSLLLGLLGSALLIYYTLGMDPTPSGTKALSADQGSVAHAEGCSTLASGLCSHAEGQGTTASGNFGSHAEGNLTTASNGASHAEGDKTTASGGASHAEGFMTTAGGSSSHAEGTGSIANAREAHAEGFTTLATGALGSHAEGDRTIASGGASHAQGEQSTASRESQDAFASGRFTTNGDAQTSRLVFRGTTPGAAVNEAVELKYGLAADQTFQLEDGKSYNIVVTAILRGRVGKLPLVRSIRQMFAVRRDGLTTIAAAGVQENIGNAGAESWTMTASVGLAPDRFVLTATTGVTTSALLVAAKVEFTEVLNP